jgi:hypothetical protein
MKTPVTVFMALVAAAFGLIIGVTSSAFRRRRDNDFLVDERRLFSDSVADHTDYTSQVVDSVQIPVAVDQQGSQSRQDQLQQLLNRGYSAEVANVILDDQDNDGDK